MPKESASKIGKKPTGKKWVDLPLSSRPAATFIGWPKLDPSDDDFKVESYNALTGVTENLFDNAGLKGLLVAGVTGLSHDAVKQDFFSSIPSATPPRSFTVPKILFTMRILRKMQNSGRRVSRMASAAVDHFQENLFGADDPPMNIDDPMFYLSEAIRLHSSGEFQTESEVGERIAQLIEMDLDVATDPTAGVPLKAIDQRSVPGPGDHQGLSVDQMTESRSSPSEDSNYYPVFDPEQRQTRKEQDSTDRSIKSKSTDATIPVGLKQPSISSGTPQTKRPKPHPHIVGNQPPSSRESAFSQTLRRRTKIPLSSESDERVDRLSEDTRLRLFGDRRSWGKGDVDDPELSFFVFNQDFHNAKR